MKRIRVLFLKKRYIYIIVSAIVIIILISISVFHFSSPANQFIDPGSGIIVIDPGHGGIDGGANTDGILEKDINLAIARKLKAGLEEKEYKVLMTREEDVSLDYLCDLDTSRHQKDLHARADIVNSCNAQLFVSIHANCNFKRPASDGSIVFYSDRFTQNKTLAYCIQRALNNMVVNGRKRTVHDPQPGEFYLLKYSQVPGAIVETAFISNQDEKRLLLTEDFQQQLADAIRAGVEKYLKESEDNQVRHQDER